MLLRRPALPSLALTAKHVLLTEPSAPPWPSYTGVSQYVGTSTNGRVDVFVDPALGIQGLENAQALVLDADRITAQNDALFGSTGGPVQVIVYALGGATDGTGGADHDGCDYTSGAAIEVCAAFGAPMRVSALFEAELSECSMGGNLCAVSTGEALSRWCASAMSGNALGDFATAPTWAADGSQNFVDVTDPTDRNADSIGCGMAFLSWLQSLGFSLSAIAQNMTALGEGALLSGLYAALTGDTSDKAWPAFMAAVQALGAPILSDDPFSGVSPPPAPPPPLPVPVPSPTPPPSVTLADAIAWAALGLTENWPVDGARHPGATQKIAPAPPAPGPYRG